MTNTIKTLQKKSEILRFMCMYVCIDVIVCSIFYHMQVSIYVGAIRDLIYTSLIVIWIVSIHKRIIQVQIRRFLIMVGVLMVFWNIVKTIKYNVPMNQEWIDRLWLMYYIPIILIPQISLFVASSNGKSLNYRIPKRLWLQSIISLFLMGLVFTNSYHNYVFTIHPTYNILNDDIHGYGIGYYFMQFILLLNIFISILIITKHSRIPNKLEVKLLPVYSATAIVLYSFMYLVTDFKKVPVLQDMTKVYCFLTILTYEAMIYTDLILVNSNYKQIFECSSIQAMILDPNMHPLITTNRFESINEERMKQVQIQSMIVDHKMRISSIPIKNGYVIYEEDIGLLLNQVDELQDLKEQLLEKHAIAQVEYDVQKKQVRIQELNRIYDSIQQRMVKQMKSMSTLLNQLKHESNEQKRKQQLGMISLIGAYVKRQTNLLLIQANQTYVKQEEVYLTFKESFDNLEYFDISTLLVIKNLEELPLSFVIPTYELFEWILEESFAYDLFAIQIVLFKKEGQYIARIRCDSSAPLHDVVQMEQCLIQSYLDEDQEWIVTLYKEGDRDVF